MMFDIGKKKIDPPRQIIKSPEQPKYIPPARKSTEQMERPKISNTGFD